MTRRRQWKRGTRRAAAAVAVAAAMLGSAARDEGHDAVPSGVVERCSEYHRSFVRPDPLRHPRRRRGTIATLPCVGVTPCWWPRTTSAGAGPHHHH